MRKTIESLAIVLISLTLTTGVAFAMKPTSEIEASNVVQQKNTVTEVKPDVQASITSDETASKTTPTTVKEETAPVLTTVAPVDNETVIWNYLIAQGFTRNQTAGIMGNLQQEHGFNTSDVAGGLGIAQWTSGRRDNLLARENPYSLTTQLNFLMEELNSGELSTLSLIKATDSMPITTQIFQDNFERCNPVYCYLSKRINYALGILNRH